MKKFLVSWSGANQSFCMAHLGSNLPDMEAGLFRYLLKPENLSKIGNVEAVDSNENRKRILEEIIQKAQAMALYQLGSYDDTAACLRNVVQNIQIKRPFRRISKSEGQDGFVILAGPSIDELNWADIKKLNEEYKCVFVDTIVKRAVKEGVVPKFVTTAEHDDLTLELFSGINMECLKDTVLICTPSACPELLLKWPGPLCLSPRKELYGQLFFGDEGALGGASVSPFSISALGKSGCKNSFLIAQDLCLNPKTGATHSTTGQTIAGYETSQTDEEIKSKCEYYIAAGNKFEKVFTKGTWASTENTIFEVLKHNGMKAFSVSPLGKKIHFAPYITMEAAIKSASTGQIETQLHEWPFQWPTFKAEVKKIIQDLKNTEWPKEITPKKFAEMPHSYLYFHLLLSDLVRLDSAMYTEDPETMELGRLQFRKQLLRAQDLLVDLLSSIV